ECEQCQYRGDQRGSDIPEIGTPGARGGIFSWRRTPQNHVGTKLAAPYSAGIIVIPHAQCQISFGAVSRKQRSSMPSNWPDIRQAYRGLRVLVLGGTGFIGSNLTRALAACGASTTIASRGQTEMSVEAPESVRRIRIDLAHFDDVAAAIVDTDLIFDLAGRSGAVQSQLSPLDDLQANIIGQYNLLEAARRLAKPPKIVLRS